MKKYRTILLAAALALCLCGCSAKITTVRPAEISEMTVARLSDGESVTLPDSAESADKKDILIFQLEEPYDAVGSCAETDGHKYLVTLYLGTENKTVDTQVYLNADGSVCKEGKRYIPSDAADRPVAIADWDALFAEGGEGASGQAVKSGSLGVTAAQGVPMEMPDGMEIENSYTAAEVLPWSYYVSHVSLGGKESVIVWRDTPEGTAQCLCSVEQPVSDDGLRHDIFYNGGAKESGGRYLYFTLSDAATFHRSLWVLDTETLCFSLMYDAPCSNMVIPADTPADYTRVGWIVYDRYLIPIELEKAQGYTDGIIDLGVYYGAAGEELFYGIGDFGTHKFALLTDLGNGTLQIDSIITEPATSAPEQRSTHQIDYVTLKFD